MSTPVPTTTTVAEPEPSATSAPVPEPMLCTRVPDATGVSVPALWEQGEVRHFDLEIRRQRTGEPTASSVTPVRVTALEVTDSDMTLEWRQGTSDISVLGVLDLGPAGSVIEGVQLPPITYQVDEAGFVVDNVADLRSYLIETWQTVGSGIGDDEAIRRTMELFESVDDATIVQLLAEDPQFLHAFDGVELADGDRFQLPASLPNAFGGRPFPALVTLELSTMRDRDDCAVVTMITEPDPDQFLDILFPTLAEAFDFDPEDLSEAQLDVVAQGFEVRNVVSMQFDVATNSIRSIEATQSITSLAEARVDTKVLTDVTALVSEG